MPLTDEMLRRQRERQRAADRLRAASLKALSLSNRSTVALMEDEMEPDPGRSLSERIDWRHRKMTHANQRASTSRVLYDQSVWTLLGGHK